MSSSAPKRRRISGVKMHEFANRLEEQEAESQRRLLYESLCKQLKSKDYKCLLSVQAFLEGNLPGQGSEDRFPRGVAKMGGPTTSAVPMYAVVKCVADATGIDKDTLEQVDPKSDLRELFMCGIGACETTSIPERRMEKSQFYAWYAAQYAEMGCPLKSLKIDTDSFQIDWQTQVGFFTFSKSCPKSAGFDRILDRTTQQQIKLPFGIVVSESQIGHDWVIANNYNYDLAELQDMNDGCNIKLCTQFEKLESGGRSTPIRTPQKKTGSKRAPSMSPGQSPGQGESPKPSTCEGERSSTNTVSSSSAAAAGASGGAGHPGAGPEGEAEKGDAEAAELEGHLAAIIDEEPPPGDGGADVAPPPPPPPAE